MYERLARPQARDQIVWSNVHVFWGDERCVPADDPESNYRLAHASLISAIDIPAANVHRMRGEEEPERAAAEYERELRTFFQVGPGGWPRFDLILLGLGEDGHTASLFPETPALNETQRIVMANYVPRLRSHRLTLTLPVLNRARQILFLVSGKGKADVVRRILGPAAANRTGELPEPAARVNPVDGRLVWLLTPEAARDLISNE